MTRTRRLLVILGFTALISVTSCTSFSSSRSNNMDTTGWITHCFGRFLIDLPPDAEINAGYYLWGDNIEVLTDNSSTLAARIDQREKELKRQSHDTKGSMFLRRVDHGKGSVSLWSWGSDASVLTYRVDSYLVTVPTGSTYFYSAEVTYDREKGGAEVTNTLARSLHSREPNEIPAKPGFCIDRAYIAGNTFQDENFEIGVTFPEYSGARFQFGSSTGAEQDRLLDRVGGFLMGAAKMVSGIETLRKGERGGPIPADEYLLAGSDKGQRAYTFAWEAQGKDESITEPNITASLGVMERSPDINGNPPPLVFKSDKEALELWDTIIDSIRLRPVSSAPLSGGNARNPSSPAGPDKGVINRHPVGDDYALEEFLLSLKDSDDLLDGL